MFLIKWQRKMNHIFDAQYPFSISIVVTEIINQKRVNKPELLAMCTFPNFLYG
jgi:hypothetical protein